jgi:murein DD-endopeptidase MepM/ murein hydrolase activator NlpD
MKKKAKGRVAVLLVRERKDGTIRQQQVKTIVLAAGGLFVVLILVALVGALLANSRSEERAQIVQYELVMRELNGEIASLQRENSELSSKISVLTETVALKAAVEAVNEEEIHDNRLPKGFPLGGASSATMAEDEDDALTMVFHTSEGNTIITVGVGVVESIEADEKYGTRLVIDHRNGYKSVYLNQGQPLVKIGEELGKRYILFIVGSNNKSLGYQIIENGRQVDPMDIMEISG